MRMKLPEKLESGRVQIGPMGSSSIEGQWGAFFVQGPCGEQLKIIANGADEKSEWWEHVSVSTRRRIPNWIEMCFVKNLFWERNECVVQFHPPESEYVNNHPYCLHLWRYTKRDFPLPPTILVGLKSRGILSEDEAHVIRQQMGLE